MNADDLKIEVRRHDLVRVAQIPWGDVRMRLTILNNQVGSWEISIPTGHDAAPHITKDGAGIIITGWGGFHLLSGPMESFTQTNSQEDPEGMLTIWGVTDEHLPFDRIVYPSPTSGLAAQGQHDVAEGNGHHLIHWFVQRNLGIQALAARRDTRVQSFYYDGATGGKATYKGRFQNLGEYIGRIGREMGMRWRFEDSGGAIYLVTETVNNRAASVRFDIRNGGLASQQTTRSAPTVTRAIVGGSGQGAKRVLAEHATPAALDAEKAWKRRIEAFVDQRNEAGAAELDKAGRDALAEGGFTYVNAQIETGEDAGRNYIWDYRLGDTVTAVAQGVEYTTTVEGWTLLLDEEGLREGVMLGELRRRGVRYGNSPEGLASRVSALERSDSLPPSTDTDWVRVGDIGDPSSPPWINGWYPIDPEGSHFRRTGRSVELVLNCQWGDTATVAFYLPEGFRPSMDIKSIIAFQGQTGTDKAPVATIDVLSGGAVKVWRQGVTNKGPIRVFTTIPLG